MYYRINYIRAKKKGSHIVQAEDPTGAKEVFRHDPVYKGARVLVVKQIDNPN